MKLSELLLPSASLLSCPLAPLNPSMQSFVAGRGKVPGQPSVLYGAIRWSHLSHSEADDAWSELYSKPTPLLHASAGVPVLIACLLWTCSARDTFQCQQASLLSSLCVQGHGCITELSSEPEEASSLVFLCLKSCMHDLLMRRIPVQSWLALVTSFEGKKYRLDYDQTPHSGHSISRRNRLEVGWDEWMPCLGLPLLCREELCLRRRAWVCCSLLTLWGEDLSSLLTHHGRKK